jgi:6-phosphogluconate dehydrogenase
MFQQAYSKSAEKGIVEIHRRFSAAPQRSWRRVVAQGLQSGVPLPAMTASLAFFDGMRSLRLPQCLIQAQRDYFGAHGFARIDLPGVHHGSWKQGERGVAV